MQRIRSLFIVLVVVIGHAFGQTTHSLWERHVLKADSIFLVNPADTAAILSSLLASEEQYYFVESDTGLVREFNPVGEPLWLEEPSVIINEGLIERAYAIRVALLGSNHPHVARSLERIGGLQGRYARYDDAIATFERALAIYERAYGPDHPELGRTLHFLGAYHRYLYRFSKAEYYLTRSLYNRETGLEPSDPIISYSLNGLAHLYWNLGRYKDAERLYKRGLILREKGYGPSDRAAVGSRSNLIRLYIIQGRFEDAESIMNEVFMRYYPTNSAYAQLGSLYLRSGQNDKAIHFARRGISALLEQMGGESPYTCLMLELLGDAYRKKGDTDSAVIYYLQAIDNISQSPTIGLGRDVEAIQQNLAGLYCQLGRTQDAAPLVQKVVHERERVFGSSHPSLADALELRSKYYLLTGKPDSATADAQRAFVIRRNHFEGSFAVMAEHEALATFQVLRESASNYISCLLTPGHNVADPHNEAFQVMLAVKGRITDGIASRHVHFIGDTLLESLIDRYNALKGRLSSVYLEGAGNQGKTNYRELVDSLSLQILAIEEELAERSSTFQSSSALRAASPASISSILPLNTVLIEFMRASMFQPHVNATEERYLAIVANAHGVVGMTDLGSAENIDRTIKRYRDHLRGLSGTPVMSSSEQNEYTEIADQLFSLIWQPVQRYVGKHDTLLISPDGALNLVSFGGLARRNGKFLIEHHPIHYATSARELLASQRQTERGTGLLLFGNPDFNAPVATRRGSTPQPPIRKQEQRVSYATRNIRTDCLSLTGAALLPLPATEQEVDAVGSLWGRNYTSEPLLKFTGYAASEENFKRLASGRRVIHLATHGYFLNGDCGDRQSFSGRRENPLLLSGLFFSGANLLGKGADSADADDGILTALEVTGLNLRGTDLVMLSACETGLGRVEQGEGTYGLRRALHLAGARTVISSLWQIPDTETMKFMKRLYATHATSYPALLQQAAVSHIREARKRGRSDHPFFWGAFMASGEWRIR